MARLSSPVSRRKLFFTVQLLALPLKFSPSASVDRTMVFSTVQLLLPYCSQKPTLVSWIHSELTVHPVPSEPSIAFSVLLSFRPTVLPMIAKLLRLIAPESADVLSIIMLESIIVYQ